MTLPDCAFSNPQIILHKVVFPAPFFPTIPITSPEEDLWIHYMSHELVGLSNTELEENYYKQDPELKKIFTDIMGNK